MTMSRYLTAQKISLLVLLKLYCQSVHVSSATIPILSFIISHAIPPAPSSQPRRSDHHDQHASFSVYAFEEVLQSHASIMPGRTLLDVFLKQLWEIHSFDALHDLFDGLGDLLASEKEDVDADAAEENGQIRITLSRNSPLGAFVRKARLEFTRLQFDDAMKLWASLITYRAPTAQWTRRIGGFASTGVDLNTSQLGVEQGDELFEIAYGHLAADKDDETLSTDDVERLLEFQLDRLQRLGCRVPSDMRAQLRSLLGSNGVVLRQTHLVKFFDAWRAGDYTTAFDSIHRYYDYAMQTREKIHYQYALLHMAILQAEFGCFSEAIAAINEAIATARENQDLTCLNFSLSWLHHMSNAYPKHMRGTKYRGMLGSERDGLTFLKIKAKDTKMYSLLSATLLNEAKLCMASGESIPRALEYMYQASHLNIKESINSHGGQMILHSTLFTRLGIAHLSSVYCDLLLHCYVESCPTDERIRALCRSAFSKMQSGRYNEAIHLLESIDASVHATLKYRQYITFCVGLIRLKRAIRQTDWTATTSLFATLTPDVSTDPEITFLLSEAAIEHHIARGHFSTAFSLIEDAASSMRDQGADVLQRVSMLLVKSTLFAKVGRPERAFSIALRAASVAFKARLMPSLWNAVGLLANIMNGLGEFEGAARLLHVVIPRSIEHSDQVLTATLYSHIADSYIGIAGQDTRSAPEAVRFRARQISRAETYIDKAQEYFRRAEDISGECEQLMKKAIIAKLRGDETLAEEWAQKHNQVWEAAKERM